jgi:hypothetical protein
LTSLLIGISGVALWLSTLTGYRGSEEVSAFILLTILMTSGVAAISYTARQRAFWPGFFGTFLTATIRGTFTTLGAGFQWAQQLSSDWAEFIPIEPIGRGRHVMAVHATIIWAVMIAVATAIGLLCVRVYDASRNVENQQSGKP